MLKLEVQPLTQARLPDLAALFAREGAEVIATDVDGRGGTWNAEGVILFAPGVSTPIMRVSTRGGPAENVTQLNTGSGPNHRAPQFLPDGTHYLFAIASSRPDSRPR